MPTWAAGNKAASPPRRQRGFSLLELLVVVSIVALASAGVMFALRDNQAVRLEREAQRLAALLDQARALSRASGRVVTWEVTAKGFRFTGLDDAHLPTQWMDPATRADNASRLLLGPEPLLAPQQVRLRLADQTVQAQVDVMSDGLRPFTVQAVP